MWSEYFWITTVIVILFFVGSSHAQFSKNNNEPNAGKKTNDTQNMENNLQLKNDNITMYSHRMLFGNIMANSMNDFVPFSNVNKNCTRDGLQFMRSLNNQTQWAIKMYDSSSKYPGGAPTASELIELGHFDRCMSVSSERFGIRGAYAVAVMRFRFTDEDDVGRRPTGPPEVETKPQTSNDSPSPRSTGPESLSWALCVPDSCTSEDIKYSVDRVLVPAFRAFNVVIDVAIPSTMYTSKDLELPNTEGSLWICGILITGFVLMVIGTLYDVCSYRSKAKNPTFWSECLYSYSMVSNTKNLMGDIKNREFAVTNGLKTLGIISVIVGHRVALDLGLPTHSTEYSEHILTDFWLSILKSPVTVEIFFIVSGFFTFIIINDRLNSGKSLNFVYLLTFRLIRILPTYTTIILIFAFILPYTGDGPLWKLIIYPEAEFCRKNWWTNLLFLNNYVNSQEMCMLHSWYLACDMHFFIIGTFLTYILWRWRKAGFGIFGVMFAVSVYIPAKYIYDNQQWGVMPYFHSHIKNLRTTEHFQRVYIKSHHRITTYLIGIASAYVYMQVKKSKLKFSAKSRTIGLILCILLHISCYFVTGYLYLPRLKYNPWNHLLYFTFQRIVYALTVSYVLVVGSLSNFGYFSSFMECKIFIVIARISYVLYLSHFIVQLQSIGQIRQPQYENFFKLYWKINADILTAFSYALVINLIIEEPIRKMIKKLMRMFLAAEQDELNIDGRNNISSN
ncbi:nose resistant to fluoxetine protein 6-like isoform X2 [Sipha flava]|nr:nose resistant to fluoxetine protein 6-like isoform X2 [Sipha flava]XP_025406645.1 nose resistant to fluoxetine protein 6-like isoform X2 [Sipha flava]XP_025406646.1 nose resistant to fluoxetine protein 6-like isoform X2 [Sipha flava]XP_025406648.1 nose resistant to fluoxetine protein 6-like isoform X2 [Sipha flava]